MVTKNKNQAEKEVTKSRVKVGKLQLGKETIKDLTPGKQKQIQGGKMDELPADLLRYLLVPGSLLRIKYNIQTIERVSSMVTKR